MQRSFRARAFVARMATLSLAAAVVAPLSAQQSAIPAPESVLGFTVGADYKTRDLRRIDSLFRKTGRGVQQDKTHRRRQNIHGPRVDARGNFIAGKSREARALSRHRAASRASRRPHRRRRAQHSRAKAARSSTLAADCTRRKSQARSTRFSSLTIFSRTLTIQKSKRSWTTRCCSLAVDQSGRTEHRRELVSRKRRHAV